MAKKLELEVISDLADATQLSADWRDLAVAAEAQPFGLPEPALAWFRHLGKGDLHLLAARDGAGRLVGLAPMHRRGRGGVSVLEFLGRGLGAVGGLVMDPAKPAVAGALVAELTEPDAPALDLVEFEVRDRGLAELRRQSTFATDIRLQNECPVIELGAHTDGQSFLAVPDRSGLRKKIAKAERQLGSRAFSIEVASSVDEVQAIRPELDAIYDAAEAVYPRLHLGKGRYAPFFDDLLVELAAAGSLAVLVGRIDGEPVAFDLHVVVGSTAFAILGRIDPATQEFSPGHLVLRAGVDWAVDAGLETIDLQIGNDEYKLRWSTATYDTASVVAAPANRLRRTRSALAAAASAHRLRGQLLERLPLDR